MSRFSLPKLLANLGNTGTEVSFYNTPLDRGLYHIQRACVCCCIRTICECIRKNNGYPKVLSYTPVLDCIDFTIFIVFFFRNLAYQKNNWIDKCLCCRRELICPTGSLFIQSQTNKLDKIFSYAKTGADKSWKSPKSNQTVLLKFK